MMIQKPIIGLVGGIGAGKSTVARLLAERGGFVIAADPIAHEALRDVSVKDRIVARFGHEVLGNDGEIDRRKLAAAVFTSEAARRELESWVHPWVKDRAVELARQADADPAVIFIVMDAPVMLEAGWHDICDKLLYVDVPRDVQLARLASRGWTAEQLAAREQAQLPAAEKARRADAIVNNGGTPDQTARQLDELLNRWGLLAAGEQPSRPQGDEEHG